MAASGSNPDTVAGTCFALRTVFAVRTVELSAGQERISPMKLISLAIAFVLVLGAAYVAVAFPSQDRLFGTAQARR
jgi:hypothetical protein